MGRLRRLSCLACFVLIAYSFLSRRDTCESRHCARVGKQFRRRRSNVRFHTISLFTFCLRVGVAVFHVYRRQSRRLAPFCFTWKSRLSVAALRNLPHHLFVFPQPVSVDGAPDWPGQASGGSQVDKAQAGALPPVAQSARSVPGPSFPLFFSCSFGLRMRGQRQRAAGTRNAGSKSLH